MSRSPLKSVNWPNSLFLVGTSALTFHHAFQHDCRNGVKPWQFDPTKWTIWLLHRLARAQLG